MENVKKFIKNNIFAVLVTLALYAVVLVASPTSRNWNSAWILLRQGFAPAMLAWGTMFSIGVGNWDFSVGANVLLASIFGGHIAQDLQLGIPGLIVGSLFFGVLCSAGTALVYRTLKIPTLITSLGMLLIYESMSGWVFSGKTLILDTKYVIMGKFPMNVICFLAAYGVAYALYYKLPVGYRIRAVGMNMKVAEANGIDPVRAKVEAMLIVGLFAGMFAAVNTGSSGQAASMSNMGSMGTCFNAMMCVCIGNGIVGKGNRIFALYCAALIVQTINMLMTALNIQSQFQKVIVAVVVIVLMIRGARPESGKKSRKKAMAT